MLYLCYSFLLVKWYKSNKCCPGSQTSLDTEMTGLNLGISKNEVRAFIGNSVCTVKTLTLTHLYCEPPLQPPQPFNTSSVLPEFIVSSIQYNTVLID
uniref:IPT/TIG domain-containing protein n=2 Tax=Naja naja TaxID=35670 RepID=A0A8C6YFA0_NAJNA